LVLIVAALILGYAVLKPHLAGAMTLGWAERPLPKDGPATRRLDAIVDKLMMCESSGKAHAINPDDGGSPSYGCLQYKKTTFFEGIKIHGLLREAEAREHENFLMDCEVQRVLARKMLTTNVNGWKHWTNCFKTIDKPAECVVE
jgi:hypothetical protein